MSRPAGCKTRIGTSGQALVEFALVLPVFVAIVFGMIDVGRYVYMSSVVSQAAREGARLAAVEASWIGSSDPACGAAGGPVCPADVATLAAHVTDAANRMVAPFGSVQNVYLRCDALGGAPTSSTWTGVACGSGNRSPNSNVVSTRVDLTYAPLTPVISGFVLTLSGSATMVIN